MWACRLGLKLVKLCLSLGLESVREETSTSVGPGSWERWSTLRIFGFNTD